ncbi:MAG TPA: DoxX family protein [Candidatus Limnocylindria bacterium]|jgi:thiosulfate dehydrogenase [quinone] large subunit|nr:DoxX family protein [Candidatus Limnocylindria bacterium]
MTALARGTGPQPGELREPPFARWLFADTRASWIWLIVRLYLGYEWLSSGLGKLGSPAWTGAQAGAAVNGFAQGALAKTGGDHPDVTGWYAWFLQNVVVPNAGIFGWLVTIGELAVGLALILGALTGIAAFFGIVMNANYLLAGTVSSNPILIILGTLLVLAWRNAGWLGLDRWLLPALGTPWQPGEVFDRRA